MFFNRNTLLVLDLHIQYRETYLDVFPLWIIDAVAVVIVCWIDTYLCNQCLTPLMLLVRTPFMARCTRYNIMWTSLSVICDRSVVFSGNFGFLHQQIWPLRYNWNIVESGVPHHKHKSVWFIIAIVILDVTQHSLIDLPNIPTVPTWFSYSCSEYIASITRSLIDLPNILTVPTWFSYSCSEYIASITCSLIDLPNILTVPTWFCYLWSEYNIK